MIPEQLLQQRFIKVGHDKRPLEKDWQNTNNYNLEEIKEWLNMNSRYGVLCGINNLVVVDFDNKEFQEEAIKHLPETFSVRTARKKLLHLYYYTNTPKSWKCLDKDKNTLCDIQGEGRQVIGAGTIVSGVGTYEVVKDIPITYIPIETLESILPNNSQRTTNTKEILSGVPEGNRNDSLFRLACSLRSKGVEKLETLGALQTANNNSPKPLSEHELKTIIESAYKYPNNSQKEIPDIIDEEIIPRKSGKVDTIRSINIYRSVQALTDRYTFITTGEKILETYYYEDGIYKKGGDKLIAQKMQEWAGTLLKKHILSEIVGNIERLTYQGNKIIEHENPNEICVANGILNLENKELTPHTPTKIFLQKISYNYNPEAQCPKIQQFLSEVLSSEDIPTLQEFIGFTLYRKYTFKKSAIFIGERDTGKTTTIKLIINLIGLENCSGESLHRIIADKFSAINLYGKLLNFYDDLSFQDLKDVGNFKIICGGGVISGEHKFGNRFQFYNYAKLLFATNKVSGVKDSDDEAYYSRWLPFFFENQFDKNNPQTNRTIIKQLTSTEEMEGLLVWAIEGLERLQTQGYFTNEQTPQQIKELMEINSDSLSKFFIEVTEREDGSWISKEELYNGYSLWSQQEKVGRHTKDKFGKTLVKKLPFAIESQKEWNGKKGVHGWLNVKINTKFTTFFHIISTNNNDNNTTFSFLDMSKNKIVNVVKNDTNQLNLNEEFILNSEKVVKPVISGVADFMSTFDGLVCSEDAFVKHFSQDTLDKCLVEGMLYRVRAGFVGLLL